MNYDQSKRGASAGKGIRDCERWHKSENSVHYDHPGSKSSKGKQECKSDSRLDILSKRWNLSGDFEIGEGLKQSTEEGREYSRIIECANESQTQVSQANEEVPKIRSSRNRSRHCRSVNKNLVKETKEGKPIYQDRKSRGATGSSLKTHRDCNHDHSTGRSKHRSSLRYEETMTKTDHSRKSSEAGKEHGRSKSERLTRTCITLQ